MPRGFHLKKYSYGKLFIHLYDNIIHLVKIQDKIQWSHTADIKSRTYIQALQSLYKFTYTYTVLKIQNHIFNPCLSNELQTINFKGNFL